MDRVSAYMVRASLLWLLSGVIIGAMMLTGWALPGEWRLALATTHPHILFVGWFLQFAVGIAYWLLPRHRTPQRQLGYDERLAIAAALALNLGLIARVVAEPFARSGNGNAATAVLLVVSALLQVAGVGLFVSQLWARATPRARRQPDRA